MRRRGFLKQSAGAAIAFGIPRSLHAALHLGETISSATGRPGAAATDKPVEALAPTSPLTERGDLAAQMVDGIHQHLLAQTAQQAADRPRLWSPDFSSAAGYEQSVAANRERFRRFKEERIDEHEDQQAIPFGR